MLEKLKLFSLGGKPLWLRITGYGLTALVLVLSIVGWYWSRTPDVFWVNAEPDGRKVVGYATVDTLVRVADRGRGMSNEVMRRALLPFYSTKDKGSGVGLPLCREIIEAHGGSLRIQSREGGGTDVSFWIPSR